MSNFGEYYTEQQPDSTWICGADYDNDVVVTGQTEAEALQNMVLALHHANGVHCVQYMKNEPDLKAVKKARAVLAENDDLLYFAREHGQSSQFAELVVSLADILGKGGEA